MKLHRGLAVLAFLLSAGVAEAGLPKPVSLVLREPKEVHSHSFIKKKSKLLEASWGARGNPRAKTQPVHFTHGIR